MLVPRLEAAGRVVELHEPHAALDQPPGQQALAAEDRGRLVVEAVEPLASPRSRRPGRRRRGPAICIR